MGCQAGTRHCVPLIKQVYAVELTFSMSTGEGAPSAEGLEELIAQGGAPTAGRLPHVRAHYFPGYARVVAFVVAANAEQAQAIATDAAQSAVAAVPQLHLLGCRAWIPAGSLQDPLDDAVTDRKENGP